MCAMTFEQHLRELREKATPGPRIVVQEYLDVPTSAVWRIWTKARGNTGSKPENGDTSGIVVSGLLWNGDVDLIAFLSPDRVALVEQVIAAARALDEEATVVIQQMNAAHDGVTASVMGERLRLGDALHRFRYALAALDQSVG